MVSRSKKPSAKPPSRRAKATEARSSRVVGREPARRSQGSSAGPAPQREPAPKRRQIQEAILDADAKRRSERLKPPSRTEQAPPPRAANGHHTEQTATPDKAPREPAREAMPPMPPMPALPAWPDFLSMNGAVGPASTTRFFQQTGRINLELAMFYGRRGRTILQAMSQLADCRTPADLWRLQLAILVEAFSDWQRLVERLSEPLRPPS